MPNVKITTSFDAEEVNALAQAIAAILLPQFAALQTAGAIINNVNAAVEGADDQDGEEQEEKPNKRTTTTKRNTSSKKTPADDAGAGAEKAKTTSTNKKAPPKTKKPEVDLTALKSDVADWLEWIEDDKELTAEVDTLLEDFGVSAEPDVEDDQYVDFHTKLRAIIAANFQID